MNVLFPLLWFCISVFVFTVFIILAFKKQGNPKAKVKTLLLGIIITDFIILSSLFYFGNVYTVKGKISEYNSITNKDADKPFILLHNSEYEISRGNKQFFSVVYGIINTPKMGAFGLKYPVIFAAAFDFPAHLGWPYGIFIVLLSILTPIIVGGFLVSYIKALWNFLLYRILRHFRNVYYFSDLNEKSMLLAEDIVAQKKERHKSLIVFCNCNKVPGIFEDRINQNYFIILAENEHNLISKSSFRKKKQYFFEISEFDNRNLDATKNIIKFFDKSKPKYFPNVRVYLFMDSSLFDSEQLFSEEQGKFNIFLVDEVKTSIYNLLFEKPLYEMIESKASGVNIPLSVAVFGNGTYAKEFFKNSYWASVLGEEYKAEISFIDSTAELFEKNLKLYCPGMFVEKGFFKENCKLNFISKDLHSDELNEILKSYVPHPTYIVIDTGDDEESINLGMYLRAYYNRNSEDFSYTPFIAIRIKDSKTASRVNSMKANDDLSYKFYSFGSAEEIYSYKLIVNSPLDKLAYNCHAAYNKSSDGQHYENEDEAFWSCNTSAFEMNSNRAAAIHIKNKLYRMGFDLKPYDDEKAISDDDKNANDNAWKKFDNMLKLSGSNWLVKLQKIEKYRWNAFHFAYGWINPPFKELKDFKKLSPEGYKPQKNVRAKMHACLCEWEQLENIEEYYHKPFREYDSVFIKDIPSIIGCQKNNPGNIAEAKFLLVERNNKGE